MPMMPMEGETHDEFMDRCMDEDGMDEASCEIAWGDGPGKSKMNLAYSTFKIKALDEDQRVIEGMATTPTPDRLGDIIEPGGAVFKLPLPLLWQHDSRQPIGHVESAKVTKDGISIRARLARVNEPGKLKDRLDEAWQSLKAGLVRGLSIGFNSVEAAKIKDTWSYHFLKWEWLELSAVTIPANAEASITAIKSADQRARAALGAQRKTVVRLDKPTPGASGQTVKTLPKGDAVKTIKEQIEALEAKRAASAARQKAVQQKALDEGRTKDQAEKEEFDTLTAEIAAIDAELVDLRLMQDQELRTAAPVTQQRAADPDAAAAARDPAQRGTTPIVSVRSNLEAGTLVARYVQAMVRAHTSRRMIDEVIKADPVWMRSTPELVQFAKTAVAAGDTTTSGWADDLVYAQNLNQFIEFLRPKTIIGRIAGFSRVPFNIRVGGFSAGTTGYWVGQGAAIPVSKPTTTAVTLAIAKAAGLTAISKELARLSTPSAEMLVRDELAKAIVYLMDDSFINPNNGGLTNEKPASMLYGVDPTAASGTTYATFRTDIQDLMETAFDNHIDTSQSVWIMSHTLALKLSMMVDSQDRRINPDLTPQGGTMLGYPAIVSQVAQIAGSPQYNNILIWLHPAEVYLADDGQADFQVSDQASIQLLDNPTNASTGSTAATTMVSMFQTESLAIKAVRYVNWAKKRTQAAQWIQNAAYVGGS